MKIKITESKTDADERILRAALKEFSTYGFSGARMERIARTAKVNKAMIFYYHASKQNLYEVLIRRVFSKLYPQIAKLISSHPTAEQFLERAAELYVKMFTQNPDFVKMMVLDLIHDPDNFTTHMERFIGEKGDGPTPRDFKPLIRRWHEEGAISEADPFQFMLNVVSLSLHSFIGVPMLEVMLQEKIPPGEYEARRIKSVINLLKRGMLT